MNWIRPVICWTRDVKPAFLNSQLRECAMSRTKTGPLLSRCLFSHHRPYPSPFFFWPRNCLSSEFPCKFWVSTCLLGCSVLEAAQESTVRDKKVWGWQEAGRGDGSQPPCPSVPSHPPRPSLWTARLQAFRPTCPKGMIFKIAFLLLWNQINPHTCLVKSHTDGRCRQNWATKMQRSSENTSLRENWWRCWSWRPRKQRPCYLHPSTHPSPKAPSTRSDLSSKGLTGNPLTSAFCLPAGAPVSAPYRLPSVLLRPGLFSTCKYASSPQRDGKTTEDCHHVTCPRNTTFTVRPARGMYTCDKEVGQQGPLGSSLSSQCRTVLRHRSWRGKYQCGEEQTLLWRMPNTNWLCPRNLPMLKP